MSGPAILVFVRAPRLGQVKTRLAREIGEDAALAIYRRMGAHAVAEVSAAGVPVRIHYTPPTGREAVAEWLGAGRRYLPQIEGDLGARMEAAFQGAFDEGHSPVVIVGSDLPGLSTGHIDEALARLAEHPAVIGPARDGGYWLLGLDAPRPELFREMEWSTARVFTETVDRLRAMGIEPALLETLTDVDELEDLPEGWAPARTRVPRRPS